MIGFLHLKKTSVNTRLITKERVLTVMHEYKEYPLYSFIPSLLNTMATLLPVLFINKLFGLENTAQLDLTQTVLAIPSIFLALSLSQVFLQKFSENINNQKSLEDPFFNMFKLLFTVSFFSFISIYIFGEQIFSFW